MSGCCHQVLVIHHFVVYQWKLIGSPPQLDEALPLNSDHVLNCPILAYLDLATSLGRWFEQPDGIGDDNLVFDGELAVRCVLTIDGCEPTESRAGMGEWLQNEPRNSARAGQSPEKSELEDSWSRIRVHQHFAAASHHAPGEPGLDSSLQTAHLGQPLT